jgi:hypothetical protein
MKKHKHKSGFFRDQQNIATGLAGVGLTTGIGSAIAPSMGSSFTTVAEFSTLGATVMSCQSVLKHIKKKKTMY